MTTTMDLDHIHSQYHQLGGTDLSDAALIRAVADRVSHPRLDPADSFILHAPLELLARAALLPWVSPDGREAARLRLVALLSQFEVEAPAAVPSTPISVDSPADAAHLLVGAFDAGALERVDALATALAAAVSPSELTALLAEAVLPRLGAAGHAPIFLYHLPRASPRGEAPVELLRPLARELARYPDLKIRWTESRPTGAGANSEDALADALRNIPRLGIPGSTFIFPVMHQVDETGVAAELLGPALAGMDPTAAGRMLLRFAARAMLAEPPDHAPYGWSHCLTMPQGALALAPVPGCRQLALDVAATYVVGMVAAMSAGPIPDQVTLPNPRGSFAAAIASGRAEAAGRVLHAPAHELPVLVAEMVTRACSHPDAHLVKYTLACLDVAAADPDASRLFLAAAASLLAYWDPITDGDDPLLTTTMRAR